MNDTIKLEDGVADFVEQVRARLTDLTVDERAELTDGLEADLAEQVAERGSSVLGDPATYAAELRAAAGFSPVMGKVREKRELSAAIHAALDSAHESWNRLLDELPQSPRPFLESLRPAWWVLRAAVAWLLAQGMGYPFWALDPKWLVVLAVFVVVSVQLGRGAWRTGDLVQRSVLARLALVGLNAFAVVALPVAFAHAVDGIAEQHAWEYNNGPDATSILVNGNGERVTNIYPYDANGKPLKGVQLFDQDGLQIPLPFAEDNAPSDRQDGMTVYPWLSNGEARFNVYPLPESEGDFDSMRRPDAWTSNNPPAIPAYPVETVPKVALPTDPQPSPATPTSAPKAKPAG
jgi:hypothetical protein